MTGRVEDAMLRPEVTEPFIERPALHLEQRALDPTPPPVDPDPDDEDGNDRDED